MHLIGRSGLGSDLDALRNYTWAEQLDFDERGLLLFCVLEQLVWRALPFEAGRFEDVGGDQFSGAQEAVGFHDLAAGPDGRFCEVGAA
jgi:hypothetical protein